MKDTHHRPCVDMSIFPCKYPFPDSTRRRGEKEGGHEKEIPDVLTDGQFTMFMNIYKFWLLCSCNDSLMNVTVYHATLGHQSALTKVRSEKETTKSERRGDNNKTDVYGDLPSTNVQMRCSRSRIRMCCPKTVFRLIFIAQIYFYTSKLTSQRD